MKAVTIYKLLATAFVVLFFGSYLFPLEDTPFEDYLKASAQVDQPGFEQLVDDAVAKADAEGKTLVLTLKELANEREIDLQARFYPEVTLSSKNRERKNDSLVNLLYQRSRAALRKGLDLVGGISVTYRIDEDLETSGNTGVESQLEDAIEIMRERVDGLGVAEPVIRAVPPNSLEVQMPGIGIEQAGSINKAARLDFRLVHRGQRPPEDAVVGSTQFLPQEPWKPDSPPAQYEVMALEREEADGTLQQEKYYVKVIPEFSGAVDEAAAIFQQGQWAISLNLSDRGTKEFADLTTYMYDVDQRFNQRGGTQSAIVLDGKLASVVGLTDQPITSGRAQISGRFSQAEAVELANVLNNPLEFELLVDDMTVVSPSLAADAQSASVKAALLGASLVVIFMLWFYRAAGAVAIVSVLLSVLVVLGFLSALSATMTLPGVAAIVLTIGMAVDANILIFERMREELRNGKSLATSLETGYEKAFSTIIDANVTTFLTAMILILMGSGPVKGFGYTLAVGIGASVFGALIISRALLEILVYQAKFKNLLPERFKKPTDFIPMNFRWPAFGVSWTIVLIGVGVLAIRGSGVLGIDFTGGAEYTFNLAEGAREEISITEVSNLAADADLGEVQAFFESVVGAANDRLVVQVDAEEGRREALISLMTEHFPDAFAAAEDGSILAGENIIGGSVSEAIRWNALLSVVLALVGILLYVAFRFEIGFGAGAVVATIHDVFMTIGIFVMLGGQFTAPMIAAILMIVGYSINDTIVVFDRIREELDLRPNMTLLELINLAINRTLSRTLLTSITTLLAAVSLFIFGAGVIRDYALVFIIGILTGTFSSIFIATPVFFAWHRGSRQRVEEREMERPVYEWEVGGSARPKKPIDA